MFCGTYICTVDIAYFAKHTSVAEPFFGSCSCCIEGHGSKEERREEEEARGRSGPYFVAIY